MTFKNILRNTSQVNLFLLSLSISILFGSCKSDVIPESNIRYSIPKYAEGYRFGVVEKCKWLECINPNTLEILTRVVRDSSELKILSSLYNDGIECVVVSENKTLATLSTTHVALISKGVGLDVWAGGAFISYLQNNEALSKVAKGLAVDLGGVPEIDKEKCVALNPSALLIYPYGDPLNGMSLNIPVIPILEYLEPLPLGRAEWMCAIGWLVGEYKTSQIAFDKITKEYEALKAKVIANKSSRPIVFTGSVKDGKWSAPGGGSLVARFIEDAGGKYMFKDGGGLENIVLDLESVMVSASEADLWGVVVYAPKGYSIDQMILDDARNKHLIPKSGKVFYCNTADVDYFGDLIVNPELVLRDLIALISPEVDLGYDAVGESFKWLPEK